MHKAAEQLRGLYGGKGQRRFRLFISVKAVILYDHATWVSVYYVYIFIIVHVAPLCYSQNVYHILLLIGFQKQKIVCFHQHEKEEKVLPCFPMSRRRCEE